MSKRYIKLTDEDYRYIRAVLIPIIGSYENTEELTIGMNIYTKDKIEYYLKAYIFDHLFGVKIKITNTENDVIVLNCNETKNTYTERVIEDKELYPRIIVNSGYGFTKKYSTLPDRYIVNKDACILFYGNNKTIVKRAKGDKIDPVKAFLWAYFLHNTGMTRTKANKYLHKVWITFLEKVYNKK